MRIPYSFLSKCLKDCASCIMLIGIGNKISKQFKFWPGLLLCQFLLVRPESSHCDVLTDKSSGQHTVFTQLIQHVLVSGCIAAVFNFHQAFSPGFLRCDNTVVLTWQQAYQIRFSYGHAAVNVLPRQMLVSLTADEILLLQYTNGLISEAYLIGC